MAEIRFTPEALADLKEVKVYIEEEFLNKSAAKRIVNDIIKSTERLTVFPLSGSPLYSVTDFESDYRYIMSGNYRVIYRYENDTIFIIRVLYGRRDFMKIIFG